MKRSVKVALILSFVLILLGTMLFTGTAIYLGFDLAKASITPPVSNTYGITEAFDSIYINGGETDVLLLPSEDGTCRVEIDEAERVYHTVEVKDGTLSIRRHDARKWYDHFGFQVTAFKIIIYLPQASLDSLHVQLYTGKIVVQEGFCFRDVYVNGYSGDIQVCAKVTGKVDANSISGNIWLAGANCEKIAAKTISGNIHLVDCDGRELTLESISGDISGNLLTPKSFSVTTVSGSINAPSTPDGDPCTITTVSGDIQFKIP